MALNTIISCLSDGINSALSQLNAEELRLITELRIRKRQPLILMLSDKAYFITRQGKLTNHPTQFSYYVDDDEFDLVFRRLCNYSVHCEIDNMKCGFITVSGGNRVGVCSTAVINNGIITAVKDISSLNIRLSREVRDCAKPILNLIYSSNLPSIIVASPPAGGKTTFLRDYSRLLSSGINNRFRKVAIVDERNEIACKDADGICADVGINTDVITAFPKDKGIEIAVRTLSPDLIVCDEISSTSELSAIKDGFLSGCSFAVSVHAGNKEQLLNKNIVKRLIETKEFKYIVMLNDYTNDFEIIEIS
ncbi:MAG: hypothetical protein ACLUH5_06390 [Eubacterium sp.]